ncbi:hypothetical protein SBA4_5040007 [Candidatus Sulfopaludibacter sp. SbA4]|nr:hypothetical protein SBA4_5040007 [Candidatus Sulfopaludibacter sp. SbA4]
MNLGLTKLNNANEARHFTRIT